MSDFQIDTNNADIPFPTSVSIDEEGLLPGTVESRSTTGYVPLSHHATTIAFTGLAEQQALNNLHLKSHGAPLDYSLSQDNQMLTAIANNNEKIVFVAKIDNDGNYTFTLHDNIDRESPQNLASNDAFSSEKSNVPNSSLIHQNISTQPGMPYQLTFYLEANYLKDNPIKQIHALWDNQLLHIINTDEAKGKGYTFSVEGSLNGEITSLQFISFGGEHLASNYLKDISVVSTAQHQLPLNFEYLASQGEESTPGHFTINVTTTPPIQLTNQIPFDIVFEQAVYQTIIVSDQNPHSDPLAIINFDALFKNLAVQNENRFVEVVQLQENGQATNVYEVKISDKNQTFEPITVADIQLSFPGGNGGLAVFQKNIAFDEDSGLPHIHHEILT